MFAPFQALSWMLETWPFVGCGLCLRGVTSGLGVFCGHYRNCGLSLLELVEGVDGGILAVLGEQ